MAPGGVPPSVPRLERIDEQAIARAAKGLAPRVRRRAMGAFAPPALERWVRALIREKLDAIADDDQLARDVEELLWARVERSGLVLVGVGDHAYIVARAAGSGGRAARLLVR